MHIFKPFFFTFAIILIGSIMVIALEDSTNFEITLLWRKLHPKIKALSHETCNTLISIFIILVAFEYFI